MKLKHILVGSVAIAVLAALAGCSSGGLSGVHNPVPNKAQTAASSNTSTVDGSATVDYSSLAGKWLAAEEQWANTQDMPQSGINGMYSTGYYLFDIDLDGDREMLVQLGGDQEQGCKTLIYKLDESGEAAQVEIAEGISLSVQNITLWNGPDGKFYINESTVKNAEDVFITSWNKISVVDGIITQEALYYQHITYDELTGNMDYMHYRSADGETEITDEQFLALYDEIFADCTQITGNSQFIRSTEWQYFTHNQKINALVNAYKK